MKEINTPFLFKNIFIPLILVLPIICFSFTTLTLGTDNIRMIRHFDIDESGLVGHAAKTYSHFVVPLEDNVTYPQLFYYLAGIAMIPYTQLKGVNYQAIVIALRSLNTLAGIATAILLYFFCLRFFRSYWVGIISSLFFTLNSQYLCWLVNSRCHPLELLFILCVIYFCYAAIEGSDSKSLKLAAIFSGLATATKFGGIFLIPIIWVTELYISIRSKISNLIVFLKPKIKLIYIYATGIIITAIAIPFSVILLYLKFRHKFIKPFGIYTLNDFLHYRNFRLLILVSEILAVTGILWIVINYINNKYIKENLYNIRRKGFPLFLNKSMLFLFHIILVNILIFLFWNPSYFIYPILTIKRMGLQFAKTTMSTALDPGIKKAIFDPGGFIWLKMLFSNAFLNLWFGLLLGGYFIYELLRLSKSLKNDRDGLFKRSLLFFYSAIVISFLILFVSHRPDHYLLSLVMILGILMSFFLVSVISKPKKFIIRFLLGLVFIPILILGFYKRLGPLTELYELKKWSSGIKDTGVLCGKWLENNYPADTKIWLDSNEFYIPPSFYNIHFMYWNDKIERNIKAIKELDPDILVITNAYDSSLKNTQKINTAIKNEELSSFELKKEFQYTGPLSKYYTKIFVYGKK